MGWDSRLRWTSASSCRSAFGAHSWTWCSWSAWKGALSTCHASSSQLGGSCKRDTCSEKAAQRTGEGSSKGLSQSSVEAARSPQCSECVAPKAHSASGVRRWWEVRSGLGLSWSEDAVTLPRVAFGWDHHECLCRHQCPQRSPVGSFSSFRLSPEHLHAEDARRSEVGAVWIDDVLWRCSLWGMGCPDWFSAIAPGVSTLSVAADEWGEPHVGRCEGEVGWSPFGSPRVEGVPIGPRHECSTSPCDGSSAVAPAGRDLRADLCGHDLPRLSRPGLLMGGGWKALCGIPWRSRGGFGLSLVPLRAQVGHHLLQGCLWDGCRSAGIQVSECSWSIGRGMLSVLSATLVAGRQQGLRAHARAECGLVSWSLCTCRKSWSGLAIGSVSRHPCSLHSFSWSRSWRGHRSEDLGGGCGESPKQLAPDRRVPALSQGEGSGGCGGSRHSATWS